jgi:hypothetical protein
VEGGFVPLRFGGQGLEVVLRLPPLHLQLLHLLLQVAESRQHS